uniref:Aldehyde dehydrogenase domain-containing protein n=2 Tax=Compsopogon caeruleus TaxID=31354 RepID=A0A7S1TI77_9RHOD
MTIFTYRDEQDLLRQVNCCPFALGSSIYSRNVEQALCLSRQVNAGMCNINDFGINYLCQSLPFGGMKDSGYDRFAGPEGLRGCCHVKSVTIDRFRWIGTTIPRPLAYPIAENGWAFFQELVALFYGSGLLSKVDNVRNLTLMTILRKWKPRAVGGGWI